MPRRNEAALRADLDHLASDRALWIADEGLDDELDATAIRHVVATVLTDKQREAVEMHFFEGLSQGEIARRLGVTQQVVQKRIYGVVRSGRSIGGALSRLREVLEPLATRRARVTTR